MTYLHCKYCNTFSEIDSIFNVFAIYDNLFGKEVFRMKIFFYYYQLPTIKFSFKYLLSLNKK